jgi:hypothetical protein
MKYKTYLPAVLRIYQIGLSRLTDRDWFFSTFHTYLDWRISHDKVPSGLFFKTLHSGVLDILGSRFFDEIFSITDDILFCDAESAFNRSSEVLLLLLKSGCTDSKSLLDLLMAIDEVHCLLIDTPEKRVNSAFHRQGIHFELHEALFDVEIKHEEDINKLRTIYAKNFAERVLHDRQLCEFISFSLTEMYNERGFPILNSERQVNMAFALRQKWPSWVLPTLQARERGKCANCGKNFMELDAEPQIDHIVSLSQGGCNDIVNLQLLCWKCNLDKLDKTHFVNSSIPEYLNWHRKMRLKG